MLFSLKIISRLNKLIADITDNKSFEYRRENAGAFSASQLYVREMKKKYSLENVNCYKLSY